MEQFKLNKNKYIFDHVGMIIKGKTLDNGNVEVEADTLCEDNFDSMSKKDIFACMRFGENNVWCYDKDYLEPLKRSKITLLEFALLKDFHDKGYRFIARDKNSNLFFYKKHPIKVEENWNDPEFDGDNYVKFILEPSIDLFDFVEWEDDEPFWIEEILAKFEVIEYE